MKKLLILLLVLSLSLFGSAMAEATITIDDMVAANDVTEVVGEDGACVSVNVIYYDENGEDVDSLVSFAYRNENGELMYVLEDDIGVIRYGGGDAVGFNTDAMRVFCSLFLDDTYEEEMLYHRDVFFLNIEGDEVITEVTEGDGTLTVVTEEPIAGKYIDYTEGTLQTEHILNAETLLLVESNEYYVPAEGEKVLLCHSWVTMDATYEFPAEIEEELNSDELRTVNLVRDPGTETEFIYVTEVPKSVMLQMVAPAGYAFYTNVECTEPLTGIEVDENGEYLDESTVYIKAE